MVNKMNLLVCGGAGFIGSNFIRYMLNKNPEVKIINYDNLTYAGNPDNLKDEIRGKTEESALKAIMVFTGDAKELTLHSFINRIIFTLSKNLHN